MATTADDDWELVRHHRLDLADALAGVDATAWDTPSLCDGWRVRDVVGHLLSTAEGAFTVRRALPGFIRHGFNVDAFIDHDARSRGQAEPADLLGRLRGSAGSRVAPPGFHPADLLTDVIVHEQDVFRPLGIVRPPMPRALLVVLRRSVPKGPPLRTRERAAGLWLHATDLDWSHGDNAHGKAVTGPATALLLALTGRAAALADLSGPGVPTLGERCAR